jgi:hypothetical protein
MTQPLIQTRDPVRSGRHAHLFNLCRGETEPDEDGQIQPPSREACLCPLDALRLQRAAIASLSREIPWPRRIFQRNRPGSPVV